MKRIKSPVGMEFPFACKDNMTLVTAYKRVCMMMVAMSPTMLNATEPVKALPLDAEQLTEILASPEQEKEVSTINFHQAQYNDPMGIAYFRNKRIQQIVPAIGNGVKANLVLTALKQHGPNDVWEVFYVKPSWKDGNLQHHPPEVVELVYHNLGPGKEFLGAVVDEYVYYDKDKPTANKVVRSEKRLDDESAQFLLDFRAGDTKWNNKTDIGFRVTNSPDLMRIK